MKNLSNLLLSIENIFLDRQKNIKLEMKKIIKPLLILIIIYSIAFYPIITVKFNYLDDLLRVPTGIQGWECFSRFSSCFLSEFIHTSPVLVDISPLTQFIAIIILAITSVIILYVFSEDKKFSFFNIIAVLLLAIIPYYLECMSYKFDSPYMAISIFACIFPFLFYKKENTKNITYFIASVLGIILMCTTYQASSGIYPLMALFLALNYWNNNESKEALKLIALSALSYITGMLIFRTFIMIPVDIYVSSNMFSIKELIPGVIKNLKVYYELVLSDFRNLWSYLIGFIVLSFIIGKTLVSKRNKLLALIINIIVIIISFLLPFGVYVVLTKTSTACRGMYGIGVLIAILAVNITNFKGKWSIIPKIVCLALVWCFFVFSFVYGNALEEQKRYSEFRIQEVINELVEVNAIKSDKQVNIQLIGEIKPPKFIEIATNKYKILDRLVPTLFGSGWVWNEEYFYSYFGIKNINKCSAKDWSGMNLPVLKDSIYCTIRGNDDYILVELKD